MKKSVLALAALSALAGVAHAQSSVSLYGRVDMAYGKRAGYHNQGINDTNSSRVGFKGVEDLGGGLKAIFNIEAGLSPDDGTQADTSRFFNRRSVVGLQDATLGALTLGREYTPTFLLVEKAADPFGTDGYSSNEAIVRGGVGKATNGAAGGASTTNHCGALTCADANDSRTAAVDGKRTDNSITYNVSVAGLNVGAQIGMKESGVAPAATSQSIFKNPYSLAASYGAGPFYVGVGYTAPGTAAATYDKPYWASLVGTYDFGFMKAFGFYGSGRNSRSSATATPAQGDKVRSWLLGAAVPVATGQVRVSYGELKNKTLSDANLSGDGQDGKVQEQFAVGYHYNLSKRTEVYTDVVYDKKAGYSLNTTDGKSKTGYAVGMKHEF